MAEGVANLVILGDAAAIEASPDALDGARIVDVRTAAERAEFAAALYELRRHKGLTPEQAEALMDDVLYFGVMMVKQGWPTAWWPAPATPRATCCARACRYSRPRPA